MAYANPSGPPVARGGGSGNPEQDKVIVEGAARWLRIVAALLRALAIVIALVGVLFAYRVSLFPGPERFLILAPLIVMTVYALLALLGGLWLGRAGRSIGASALLANEEQLGLGFRQLKLFFCVYGVFTLMPLIDTVILIVWASCAGERRP